MEILYLLYKHHFKSIFIFLFLITTILTMTAFIVYDHQLEYMENNMIFNINEYDEIDKEHLCELLECNYVVDLTHKKRFKMTEDNILKRIEWIDYTDIPLWRNLHLINYNISLYNADANSYFEIGNETLKNNLLLLMGVLIPLTMISFMYPLMISIRNEKEESIRIHVGNEALLANKSMIMITENIHHELNTPLEVIDNKIEKIHRIIEEYLASEYEYYEEHKDEPGFIDRYNSEVNTKRDINSKLISLNPDFEFIKVASEQIYNILDKMKGFKHMRYSNGNKSIADIVDAAFKIISISNGEFEHKYDQKLSNYSINSKSFKNADLLGILINNIKNSLEASADKVYILVNKFEDGFLKIRIIDNGKGIPKKAIKNIFEPNFSTKSADKTIRGNGMYLNRQILHSTGGDTYVVETSTHGTTLELVFPVVERETDD